MASKTAIPDDQKSRIIAHMNREHQDSLVLYLEHYLKQSSFAARSAHLTDLSLAGMSIATSPSGGGGVVHTIPFDPPLSSGAELRGRVVEMDTACRGALARDVVTVKRYARPAGVVGMAFAGLAFWTLLTTLRPANFLPGSWLYDNAYGYVPAFAALNHAVAPYVFWSIVVLHGLEAIFIMRPKLRKHNVPTGSALWWKWMASDFFLDGFATLLRFDKVVADEKKAKEAKAH